MRNRLIEAASEVKADQPLGREGLEEWCAQKNEWAARIGMDRWYRVRTFESAGSERHEVQSRVTLANSSRWASTTPANSAPSSAAGGFCSAGARSASIARRIRSARTAVSMASARAGPAAPTPACSDLRTTCSRWAGDRAKARAVANLASIARQSGISAASTAGRDWQRPAGRHRLQRLPGSRRTYRGHCRSLVYRSLPPSGRKRLSSARARLPAVPQR